MKRGEVLSFINEVKQFDGVNDVKVIFINECGQQRLDEKERIAYIDGNVFDCLQDDVQKFLIIYVVLLLSGDGLPKISDAKYAKEEWANDLCQKLGVPCFTEKDLSIQEMYAKRKCYDDETATFFKVGQVLIKPPYLDKYAITNIGDVTLDNKRPISLQTDDGELVLDEETLIREFAILANQ